jgi:hypothetical protein
MSREVLVINILAEKFIQQIILNLLYHDPKQWKACTGMKPKCSLDVLRDRMVI